MTVTDYADRVKKILEVWDSDDDVSADEVRELLQESLRTTCPCGNDTASIKWAQCYNCRNSVYWDLDYALELLKECKEILVHVKQHEPAQDLLRRIRIVVPDVE